MSIVIPSKGQTVWVGPLCGAQFRGLPWRLRLLSVEKCTYFTLDEMCFLSGYKLGEDGLAEERRPLLLVITGGLRIAENHELGDLRQLQSRPTRVE